MTGSGSLLGRLLFWLVALVLAAAAIKLLFWVLGMAVGLAFFLLFTVLPVAIVGWMIVKAYQLFVARA